jgi:hypothetical protein
MPGFEGCAGGIRSTETDDRANAAPVADYSIQVSSTTWRFLL